MFEYSSHIILTNMGYLSCYICSSLLLYKFIDAYNKSYNFIKILTIVIILFFLYIIIKLYINKYILLKHIFLIFTNLFFFFLF